MEIVTKWMLCCITWMIVWRFSSSMDSTFFKKANRNEKISAPYTMLSLSDEIRPIRCAGLCRKTHGCWLFTWDSQTRECGLLQPLTSFPSTVAAPPSLSSYYVSQLGNSEIAATPTLHNWENCKLICQDFGGRLYLPTDQAYAYVLHYVFGRNIMHIGMYRNPSNTTVWYDMDGNVITEFLVPWHPNQPNNGGGSQYYIRLWTGLLDDGPILALYSCLCEIYLR